MPKWCEISKEDNDNVFYAENREDPISEVRISSDIPLIITYLQCLGDQVDDEDLQENEEREPQRQISEYDNYRKNLAIQKLIKQLETLGFTYVFGAGDPKYVAIKLYLPYNLDVNSYVNILCNYDATIDEEAKNQLIASLTDTVNQWRQQATDLVNCENFLELIDSHNYEFVPVLNFAEANQNNKVYVLFNENSVAIKVPNLEEAIIVDSKLIGFEYGVRRAYMLTQNNDLVTLKEELKCSPPLCYFKDKLVKKRILGPTVPENMEFSDYMDFNPYLYFLKGIKLQERDMFAQAIEAFEKIPDEPHTARYYQEAHYACANIYLTQKSTFNKMGVDQSLDNDDTDDIQFLSNALRHAVKAKEQDLCLRIYNDIAGESFHPKNRLLKTIITAENVDLLLEFAINARAMKKSQQSAASSAAASAAMPDPNPLQFRLSSASELFGQSVTKTSGKKHQLESEEAEDKSDNSKKQKRK